jgi:NADH-quinone oxidoreductase subunit E
MIRLPENISPDDPLMVPEKRAVIDRIIAENECIPGAVMVVLNELQRQVGYISEPMQAYTAEKLHVPMGAVHGVVTFYSFFTTKPRGRHTIKFCMGTACYVGGVQQIIDKARHALGIELGDTTPDGSITMELCRCVGACSQAPVVVVDEDAMGRVKPNKFPQVLRKLQEAPAEAAVKAS